jgi:cobalamin biosynthetic protein CobC
MLEHGGRLRAAATQFGIPLDQWIDLSTGISPWLYPIPQIPNSAWHRLPEPDDDLDTVAAQYYGNVQLLATAGSQAAIQQLPLLFARSRVAIIRPTYNEHIAAWRNAHDVQLVESLAAALATPATIILLCNPNNPTATHYTSAELLDAATQLRQRDGWLLVDEAYGDAYPEHSVTPFAGTSAAPRLITLRSLGKFFGLAGARVGFVFADSALLDQLSDRLGPWTISGPARWIANQALANTAWQANQITHIKDAGVRLKLLITHTVAPDEPVKSTGLFSTFQLPNAEVFFEHLAQRGILVRLFREESLIRIGIAADHEWKRLELALTSWRTTTSQRLA